MTNHAAGACLFLVVKPNQRFPVLRRGEVIVPPKMERAAESVLREMALDIMPKRLIIKNIIHRYEMANANGLD